jgi:hypothetical protein
LRYCLRIFLEDDEDPEKVGPSYLVSGLCAGDRDFLRALQAFPGLAHGYYLHVVIILR